MAIRSIIEVDVADESFQTFRQSFERYQAAVKELPGAWSKVAGATEKAGSSFGDAVAALLAGNEQLMRANRQAETLGRTAHTADGSLQKMVTHSHQIAGNFLLATRSLLKWTGIATALGGLAGFGGLFGLDRLANSVSAGRRSSMGLGVSSGALQAWGVDLRRVVDPSQFLSAVNRGVLDPTSQERIGLMAAGIPAAEIASGDTGRVGLDLLRRQKALADKTPLGMLGPNFSALQQSPFIDLETARRLKALSPAELARDIGQTGRDAKAFNLTDPTQKKWQDFQVQLGRAGKEVETVFIKDLTPLVPSLSRLSSAFAVAVDEFLRAPQIKEWINDLAIGIKSFAGYLETPAFAKNIQDFIGAIGVLAADTVAIAKWLDGHLPSNLKVGAGAGAVVGGALAGPPGAVVGAVIGAGAGGRYDDTKLQTDRLRKGYYQGLPVGIPPGTGDWGEIPKAWDAIKHWSNWFNPISPAHAATEPGGLRRSGGPTAPLFNLPRGPVASPYAATPSESLFLKSLARGEAQSYSELYGGGSLKGLPTDQYGFPLWAGKMGPSGISHAAGLYQFEPKTWDAEARKLGLKDFSHKSQDIAAWDLAATTYATRTHRDLAADLTAGRTDDIAKALHSTWTSATAALTGRLSREFAGERAQHVAAAARAAHAAERNRVRPSQQRQPGRIVVENRTGGSAIITGASMARPT